MKNILITGGPVHAHLDSVKIITNNFKGGLIAELAHDLSMNGEIQVTYLCSKASKLPAKSSHLKVVYHEGFDDYLARVLEMAPKMDAVILGAAVANLIPYKAIEGKFPSHNYKPGDLVPLIFKIAPRVIDEVKKVAPKVHLFGFKLLDNVPQEELIKAAYGVLLESRATAVIANDRRDLEHKYIVTKERAVHPVTQNKCTRILAEWIWNMVNDEYYTTSIFPWGDAKEIEIDKPNPWELKKLKEFSTLDTWGGFIETPEGYVFGTLAQRCGNNSFWTTGRGKREADSYVYVNDVNHVEKRIHTLGSKATLNAPLLSHTFLMLPEVDFIAHSHVIPSKFKNLPYLKYAPPGTVRDSRRTIKGSFIIENHGLFLLYNRNGAIL
ncbi:MAG: hypothetical protein IMZ64_00195 [Bacteroidetes bacterium]|nr:hypothetical protein [Bacteroidota bacterium]